MKNKKAAYIKKTLFPCLTLSVLTGVFVGVVIFIFKLCSSRVLRASAWIYDAVREKPIWLPVLLLGASAIGLLAAVILKHDKSSQGGGIPTSVSILRGLIDFSWVKNLFILFVSTLLTFLGGVPLGTEGPSVQMGTAIGRGTIRIFGKKQTAWDRYIMTSGASSGFAVATCAPLSGILFAFEEAHSRFSPLLFMTVSMSVTTSTATMHALCKLTDTSPFLFNFSYNQVLPLKSVWIAIIIGVACGLIAILFTEIYSRVGKFMNKQLARIPFEVKIVSVFVLLALLGFASGELIGTGHELIESLTEGHGVWYMLLIYFCVRGLSLMVANRAGVSGGTFIPTLAFGALIGTLFSQFFVRVGLLSAEYFIIPVIIGMASFLAASSRTPIMAIAFSIEALGGLSNSLPIAIGVMLAFFVIEIWGVPSLQDVTISQKVKYYNEGKESITVDTCVTVMPDSFAEGKEVRNILWPPSCTVLSVEKPKGVGTAHEAGVLGAGDILHIHYKTYDPPLTERAMEAIVGRQLAGDDREATTDINGGDAHG